MNENLQKICDKYMDYILGQLKTLLDIDSPTGYTKQVGEYLMAEYTRLGYTPRCTRKGGVLVDLGGSGNAVLVMAHVDTLGAMVAEVKDNGRLRLTPLGASTPTMWRRRTVPSAPWTVTATRVLYS